MARQHKISESEMQMVLDELGRGKEGGKDAAEREHQRETLRELVRAMRGEGVIYLGSNLTHEDAYAVLALSRYLNRLGRELLKTREMQMGT